MNRVSIVTKPNNPESVQYLKKLVKYLEKKGIGILLEESPDYNDKDLSKHVADSSKFKEDPGFVIVVGGDGTLLRTARQFAGYDIPVLGINTGMLGFLAEFSPDEAFVYLNDILEGRFEQEERAMLEVGYNNDGEKINKVFLNDAVISRGTISHLITIHLEIDGKLLSSFTGDGLIIATATGSTGYSLSAGGPIITPTIKNAFIIIPICPHTLTIRPLIIPSSSTLKVKTVSKFDNLLLTIDGQENSEIKSNEEIVFSGTDKNIHLIIHPKRNFYEILREKFGWGRR